MLSRQLKVSIPHRYGTTWYNCELEEPDTSIVSIPHRYGTTKLILVTTLAVLTITSQFLIGTVLLKNVKGIDRAKRSMVSIPHRYGTTEKINERRSKMNLKNNVSIPHRYGTTGE